MKIFVHEYTCANPGWATLPESLRQEGLAMLTALMEDFQKIEGVEVLTLLADDFPQDMQVQHLRAEGNEEEAFFELAQEADYTLVIAPEFENLLAQRRDWIDQAGGKALISEVEAINLTADKLALYHHFVKHQIPTPFASSVTWQGHSAIYAGPITFPAVCKPRHGAGSISTFLVENRQDLDDLGGRLPRKGQLTGDLSRSGNNPDEANQPIEMILQDCVFGFPASAFFLVGSPGKILMAPFCKQRITKDRSITYNGGVFGTLEIDFEQPAASHPLQAIHSIPGLFGFVGVDFILNPRGNSVEIQILEINPRLTTSYIGLRHLTKQNLAKVLLQMVQGESPTIQWRQDVRIEFDCQGRVQEKPWT